MDFDPAWYGPTVARILALDGYGDRLLPLRWNSCSNHEAEHLLKTSSPATLFPNSPEPRGAMAGLWFYFDCFEQAHQTADACENSDGYYWHALVHRREGDSGNAAYWFRKVGVHPAYPRLAEEAAAIINQYPGAEFRVSKWDPFAFVLFCERAQEQPGTVQEQAAAEIQRAEWQLLFNHCARPR
jgi:hypothetical protein